MTPKPRPTWFYLFATIVAGLVALAVVIIPLLRAIAFLAIGGLLYVTKPPKLRRHS